MATKRQGKCSELCIVSFGHLELVMPLAEGLAMVKILAKATLVRTDYGRAASDRITYIKQGQPLRAQLETVGFDQVVNNPVEEES